MELEIVKKIVESKAITIRDVDNGEDPFIYSSGNQGCGYIMIKGLCGQPKVMHFLMDKLAEKVSKICPDVDFIDGNVTGGVIAGWELRNKLSEKLNRNIPFVYLRVSRKKGGHDELITGIHNNNTIKKGMEVIVVEELVNYGTTTINAVEIFRNCGYIVNYAATILSYNHKATNDRLKKNNIKLISLITLDSLLEVANENNLLNNSLIKSYSNFLNDSIKWQLDRNLPIPEKQAKLAIKNGYNMVKLNKNELLENTFLKDKIKQGVVYWKKCPPMVIVALDDKLDLDNKIYNLSRYNIGFKINLDIFTLNSELIEKIKFYDKLTFVDLKMWNGKRTMTEMIKKCIKLKIDIVNVYAQAGKKVLTELTQLTKGTNTKLYALTVLTHYDEDYAMQLYGKSIRDTIDLLSTWAEESNCDGIILPAQYLNVVKNKKLLTMCPGIRPLWYENKNINNQVQISTPTYAVKNGANYLVIGSPIFKTEDYTKSLELILNEIDESYNHKTI